MLKNNKLPKSFAVGAQTINVVINNALAHENILGQCDSVKNLIEISEVFRGEALVADQIEDSFYHELTHLLFEKVGRLDLSSDEGLVINFSLVLHQALKSLAYE